MQETRKMLLAGALMAAAVTVSPLRAGEPAAHEQAAPGGSPEEKAMMEAVMKAATPGPMHELLKASVGRWELAITSYMAPGAPPTVSKATAERRLVWDRFVIEEAKGDPPMPGMPPFEGMGISGYDNVSQEFFSTWMDSLGTGIMMSTGSYDPKTRTFSYKGTYNDPITGKPKTVRMTVKAVDDTHTHFEMFDKGPDGKEFKSMVIEYVKK